MITLQDKIGNTLLEQRVFKHNPLTEAALASQFGVSRTPIREALLELEVQNLIVRRQRKGLYLRVPSRREVCDLYEVRAVLEGLAAGKAALRITDADITCLQDANNAFVQANRQRQIDAAIEFDGQLHERLATLADNTILVRLLKGFNISRRAWTLANGLSGLNGGGPKPRASRRAQTLSHARIIEKLAARDAAGAESAMRRHLFRDRDALLLCTEEVEEAA